MNDDLDKRLDDLEKLVTDDISSDETKGFFETQLSLPSNPFPPSGIADSSGDNPPLQAETFNEIYRFIRQSYASKRRQLLVLQGDYGTGKTHTLHFIEYIVNNRMSKGERSARAIYVERPRIEAHELNRTVLRSLGYDTVRKYTWFALQAVLINHMHSQSDSFKRIAKRLTEPKISKGKRQSNTLWDEEQLIALTPFNAVFTTENVSDYRTFLQALEGNGWNREDVRSYFVELLLEAVGGERPTDLAQLFIALLLAPDEASFSSWETLLGITNPRSTASLRAPTFLKFLLRLLELNGIAYVYLLLDEFEEVSQGSLLTARQRQDYLYTIREVLNSIQTGLSIIMAISPAGWDAIVSIATPLADVNDKLIYLKRIEVDDLVKLVQYYFSRERHSTDFSNISAEEIRPFSRESLAYILENLPRGIQPTPRNLIQFLHTLLNHMAETQQSTIDPLLLDTVLQDFGAVKSTVGRQTKGRR